MTTEHSSPYRYAIYFTPTPTSEWGLAGSQWLGRCALTGTTHAPPEIPGLEASVYEACTREPRRYGWHATLKAPFQLLPGLTRQDLMSRLRLLASQMTAFTLPALRVSTLGNFLALRPEGDTSHINAIAATCVKDLHDLTLPLSAEELARRRSAPLTAAQDQMLVQWAYPWVMAHFRFHLSLTGSLESICPEQRQALIETAQKRFHGLADCRFDHLALFIEAEKGSDFQMAEMVELRA